MKVRLKQYAFCIKFRVYFPIIIHLLLVFQSPWRFFSCWHLSVLYQCKYIANVIIVSTCKDQYFMYFRSGDEIVRKPRLFYVSTSSTTSTVSTASICFITTSKGPVGTCAGKRRRRMVQQAGSSITPSKFGDTALVSSPEDLAVDGRPKASSGREGRFLLYWITTTSTSTTTSYTTTYSISSVSCTFPGISLCGK